MEATEITFNIINSINALATFGAFLMLFFKDKQKQIDKLASIATIIDAQNESLKEQNDMTYKWGIDAINLQTCCI